MNLRDIDRLVAEHVMGLHIEDGMLTERWIADADYVAQFSEMDPQAPKLGQQIILRNIVPFYSADISAAWQVVEKLKRLNADEDIHIEHLYGEWAVSTCHTDDWEFNTSAATAPLAICLAALAAYGIETPK